jgi:hypothetical protein
MYLLRFKMNTNGIPQEIIKKRIVLFVCYFWGIIISLSCVAYSFHNLELQMYLVISLILGIGFFIFLGIRRVNHWINETYFL